MVQQAHPAATAQGEAKPDAAPLQQLILKRHSSRGPFDVTRPVPDAALQALLEAARWAPTAHNMQNFAIIAVDDPTVIARLGHVRSGVSPAFLRENYRQMSFSHAEFLARKRGVLAETFPPAWRTEAAREGRLAPSEARSLHDTLLGGPLLLVVVYDADERAPGSEHDALGFISLGCVMENLWLTATALGLGLHIISALSANLAGADVEDEVRTILHFPAHFRIGFSCRIGYPLAPAATHLRVRRDIGDFCHHNAWGHARLD